jgi:hypothetical protein
MKKGLRQGKISAIVKAGIMNSECRKMQKDKKQSLRLRGAGAKYYHSLHHPVRRTLK